MTKNMTFLDHLEDLRKNLFRVCGFFLVLFSVCAYYSKELFHILQLPLLPFLNDKSFFIATTAATGWVVFLKTAFMVALILVLPFVLLQIFTFTNPGLKTHERRLVWPLTFAFLMFFYLGIVFCYTLVLPYGYEFLLTIYKDSNIQFLPQISDYLSFTTTFLLAFGIMFDLPFAVLILIMTGLLSFGALHRFRPYFYVLAFVVAAILTPPDYISQTLMAVPMILLFEFGVFLSWLFKRRQKPI